MYSIIFSATKKRFYLSLHYNEDNSYFFFNGNLKQKIQKF